MTVLKSGSLGAVLLFVLVAIPLGAQASSMWREGFEAYTEGDYDEASRIYNEARRDLPESTDLAFNLGCVAYQQGHYKEAIAFFEEALASGDAALRSGAWYNLGNAQARLGQLQQSVASYQNALLLDSDQEDCQHNLEWVLRKLEQQENEAADGEAGEDSPSPGTTSPQDPGDERRDTDGNNGDEADDPNDTEPEPPPGAGTQDDPPADDEPRDLPEEKSGEGTAETLTEEEAERLLNRIEEQHRGQRRRMEYPRAVPGDRDW